MELRDQALIDEHRVGVRTRSQQILDDRLKEARALEDAGALPEVDEDQEIHHTGMIISKGTTIEGGTNPYVDLTPNQGEIEQMVTELRDTTLSTELPLSTDETTIRVNSIRRSRILALRVDRPIRSTRYSGNMDESPRMVDPTLLRPAGIPQTSRDYTNRSVRIGPSAISSAGEGLFAIRDLKPGQFICEYEGTIMTYEAWKASGGIEDGRTITDGHGMVCVGNPESYGCKINDPFDDTKCNAEVHYMTYERRFIVTVMESEIPNLHEVYMAYGNSYWALAQRMAALPKVVQLQIKSCYLSPKEIREDSKAADKEIGVMALSKKRQIPEWQVNESEESDNSSHGRYEGESRQEYTKRQIRRRRSRHSKKVKRDINGYVMSSYMTKNASCYKTFLKHEKDGLYEARRTDHLTGDPETLADRFTEDYYVSRCLFNVDDELSPLEEIEVNEIRVELQEHFIPVRIGKRRVRLVTKEYMDSRVQDVRIRRVLRKLGKRRAYKYDNPSMAQAKKRDDWDLWHEAIETEYRQMRTEGVFGDRVFPPPGADIVGCMMVLVIKRTPDGKIDKYKARLVALGNQQGPNTYDEIKSSTARAACVKFMFALQAKFPGKCKSMVLDIKGAYLKSAMGQGTHSDIYLRLTDGTIVKLEKYLYGLRQSGKMWQDNITQCLKDLGYQQSTSDPMTFYRVSEGKWIYMVIHVDDFFVLASDDELLERLMVDLRLKYGVGDISQKKDLVMSYLGMHVEVDPVDGNVTVSQPGYIAKLLEKYNPLHKKKRVPIPQGMMAKPGDDTPFDKDEYLQLIGSLAFLAQFSRPDIMYAVSIAAQQSAHPTRYRWRKAMHIIYYLETTPTLGLIFKGGPIQLECWVDAGFNQDDTAACQYGYGLRLSPEDGFFFVVSKKIKLAVTSSTQAEYVALYEAAREVTWMRRLLVELEIPHNDAPTPMYEDNEPCIDQVIGQVMNFQATKHYLPKYMYTRRAYAEGEIDIQHVETKFQIADIFTKALGPQLFLQFTANLLGVQPWVVDPDYDWEDEELEEGMDEEDSNDHMSDEET